MTFLPDLPDDEPDVIEMCDVEIHGTCDRCDHPCPAYFLHRAWFDVPDYEFERVRDDYEDELDFFDDEEPNHDDAD